VSNRTVAIRTSGSDGVLEPLVRFRSDLVDVGRATLGLFRVIGRIPRAGRKLQGFALLIAAHMAPEDIDWISAAWLVFNSGEPGEFLRYLMTLGMGSSSRIPSGFPPWCLSL
jgi:hypothetical protein